jgi:hypothetical protein
MEISKRAFSWLSLAITWLVASPVQSRAQIEISWSTVARSYRGRADPVTLHCSEGGRPSTVWGTDIYTDDSSICTAAVHAGVITFDRGGTIVLEMRPGRNRYVGSRRNGVSSEGWQEWDASFSVTEYVEPPPPEPPKPPPPPPAIAWDRTAVGLAPNGRQFTFVCRPPALRSPVVGVDLYSWDSSICNAAVHAGAISLRNGGTVTIEMRPGAERYPGSVRNGIASMSGEATILGFVVIKTLRP